MSKLDRLLQDPRSHRAVPEREMIDRVSARALEKWHEQSALSAFDPASAAAPSSAKPRTRLQRLTGHSRARWSALILVILAGWATPNILRDMPRLDMHLKYWLYDLIDAVGAGIVQQPLATAFNLAAIAALCGFALSSQARAGLRRLK
jgi:hypothetical protein